MLTGDAAFDKAFHVEGAPSDVVIASLTAEVRAHLLGYPHCAVELAKDELVERHRELDTAALEPCLRAVIAFAIAIERARDEIPKLRALPTDAHGFRETPSAVLVRDDRAELELAQLAEMRRSRHAILIPGSMIAAGVAYVVAILWLGLPLVFLLLALPASLFGGLALSLVLSTLGRVTGISKALGVARVRALTGREGR